MAVTKLTLAAIRADGGTQPREAINFTVVEDYKERIAAGDKFPPLVVFYDGTFYWLADGYHRYNAYCSPLAEDVDLVDVEVHQGTREDAVWYSCAANRGHGLRRSGADKRRAIASALKLRPDSSDVILAAHVGVSDKTVATVRAELEATSEIPRLPRREGADGKRRHVTQSTSEIPKSTKRTGRDGRTSATGAETRTAAKVTPAAAPVDTPASPVSIVTTMNATERQIFDGDPDVRASTVALDLAQLVEGLQRHVKSAFAYAEKIEALCEEHAASVSSPSLLTTRSMLAAVKATVAGVLAKMEPDSPPPAAVEKPPAKITELYSWPGDEPALSTHAVTMQDPFWVYLDGGAKVEIEGLRAAGKARESATGRVYWRDATALCGEHAWKKTDEAVAARKGKKRPEIAELYLWATGAAEMLAVTVTAQGDKRLTLDLNGHTRYVGAVALRRDGRAPVYVGNVHLGDVYVRAEDCRAAHAPARPAAPEGVAASLAGAVQHLNGKAAP